MAYFHVLPNRNYENYILIDLTVYLIDLTGLQNTATLLDSVLENRIPYQIITKQKLEEVLSSVVGKDLHLIGIPSNILQPDNFTSATRRKFLLDVITRLAEEAELELACNHCLNGTIVNQEISICLEELIDLIDFYQVEDEEKKWIEPCISFRFNDKQLSQMVNLDEPDLIRFVLKENVAWDISEKPNQSCDTETKFPRFIAIPSPVNLKSENKVLLRNIVYERRNQILKSLQEKIEARVNWKDTEDYTMLKKWISLLFELSSSKEIMQELIEFLIDSEFLEELLYAMTGLWIQLIFDFDKEKILADMNFSLEVLPSLNFTSRLNYEVHVTNGPKHYAGDTGLIKFRDRFDFNNYQLVVCAALPFFHQSLRFEAAEISNYFLKPSINIIKKVGRFALFQKNELYILHAAIEDDAPRIFSQEIAKNKIDYRIASLFLNENELQFLIAIIGKLREKNKLKKIQVHCREGWNRSHFMSGLISFIEYLYQEKENLMRFDVNEFLENLRQKTKQHVKYPSTGNRQNNKINKNQFVSYYWEAQFRITINKIYQLFESVDKFKSIQSDEFSIKWHQLALILQQQLDKMFEQYSAFINLVTCVAHYIENYIEALLIAQNSDLPAVNLLVRYVALSKWMQQITLPPPKSVQATIDPSEIDRVIAEILTNPLHEDIHDAVKEVIKPRTEFADKLAATGMGIGLVKSVATPSVSAVNTVPVNKQTDIKSMFII